MPKKRLTQTFDEVQEILNDVDGKVDKIEGKGLSTEDYTSEEKQKLAGIEDGAQVNVRGDWEQDDPNAADYIKNRTHWAGATATEMSEPNISYSGRLGPTPDATSLNFGFYGTEYDFTEIASESGVLKEYLSPLYGDEQLTSRWHLVLDFTNPRSIIMRIINDGEVITSARFGYISSGGGDFYSLPSPFPLAKNVGTDANPVWGAYLPQYVRGEGVHKLDNKYLDTTSSVASGSDKPVTSGGVYTAVSAKYTKPATGIPAADLAEGVIPDVSNFITKSVNDLTYYYLKTETYSQTEINNLIGAIQQFHYEIAASTSAVTDPQPNVLYLIGPTGSGADKYEEYVYANSTWTKIGDTSIDLSDYVTTTALNTALADYTTTANLTTLLAGKQDTIDSTHKLDYALLSNTPEPDNEDITLNSSNKFQFADRTYNTQTPDGLGYKILRKDATFAQQVTDGNTIYEIRYDFDLSAGTVSIPAGCVLRFNGGSVVNGTITGNKTIIEADAEKIFGLDTTLSGTFKNEYIYTEWFGAVADGTSDNFTVFQKVFNQSIAIDKPIQLLSGTYVIDECPSDGDGQTLRINFTADGQQFRLFGEGRNSTEIKSANGWLDRLYSKHDSGSASDYDILRQKKLIYYLRNNNYVAELVQISGICLNRNGFSNTVQPSTDYAWESQTIIASAAADGYTGTSKHFVYTDLYIKNRTSSGIGFGNAVCDSVVIKDVISDRRRYFAGVREEIYPLAKCQNILIEDCDVSFIHIEPLSTQSGPRNATIRNCTLNTLEWNDVNRLYSDLLVEGCTFDDANINLSGVRSTILNCTFNYTHSAESQVAGGDSYIKEYADFRGCTFTFTPDENGLCNVINIMNSAGGETKVLFDRCQVIANNAVMHSHVFTGGYQVNTETSNANAKAEWRDCTFYSNCGATSKDGTVAAGKGLLINCIRGLNVTLNNCVLFRTGSGWVFKAGYASSGTGNLILNHLKVFGESGYTNLIMAYILAGGGACEIDIKGEYDFVQMLQPYYTTASYATTAKTKDFVLVTNDPANILSINYKTYIPGTKIKVGNLLYTYNRDYINRADLNINDFLVELINKNITTAERLAINTTYLPANSSVECFDTTLGKTMVWNGTAWEESTPGKENVSNKVTSLSSSSTDTQYPSAKCVYDNIHPAIGTTQPSGGFLPNVLYNLGTLTGTVTFELATPADANIVNHYFWTFDTSSTAPTITWPTGLTWNGGSAPTIGASKHYEISILNGIAAYMEV